jgi:CheY-like chemotaxis protein
MALVLVIDDDSQVRRMVRRILAQANHVIIEAEDGEAGMKSVRDERPALVITDLFMPRKEGIETIREIRRASPATKVIAISGSEIGPSGALYLDAASKLGADMVLAKPFRSAELLAAVARALA